MSAPVIVPKPVELKVNAGQFTLTDNFTVHFDDSLDLSPVKNFITTYVCRSTGFNFKEEAKGKAQLEFNKVASLPLEHYHLELTPEKLVVEASSVEGHFYGLQTFIQLFPPEIFADSKVAATWTAPCVTVNDKPRFQWRGSHLDCSRHFQTIDEIHTYLYRMSIHKLNTFHWHLTDDQGWRMESKKWPKLTEISCKRIEKDGSQYGPFFYTVEEMKEIVAFAKNLCITVVPEIELPGHSCAVLAAYPELSCGIDAPFTVENNWGIFKPIYCLGNDQAVKFLFDILGEACEIFPSKYIHIGGDEVLPDYWLKCPKCQAIWEKEGIKDPMGYQGWFNKKVAQFLKDHGRVMIGWDEILEGDLPKENAIMAWNSAKTGEKAANMGHPVVMTPMECFYLDHCQFQKWDGDKYEYIGGMATLKQVYDFNPTNNIENPEKIIGCQVNVWTERMYGFKDVEWKVFPRICALAEVAWTPNEKKDYKEFKAGLNRTHLLRLKQLKINYARKHD